MEAPPSIQHGEPRLIVKSAPIDIELCELLGDRQTDFIVLCADGVQVPGYGTPFDTAAARSNTRFICARLNERAADSWWPEFFGNWKDGLSQICTFPPEATAAEFHPVFSFAISRVCVGYSENLHCAIRLFEDLRGELDSWRVGVTAGVASAELQMGGTYRGTGADLAQTICGVVAAALRKRRSKKKHS